MGLFRRIFDDPQFQGLSFLAAIGGGCMGWVVHAMFPAIPVLPAVFVGLVVGGATMQFALIARYIRTMIEELNKDFKEKRRDEEGDGP